MEKRSTMLEGKSLKQIEGKLTIFVVKYENENVCELCHKKQNNSYENEFIEQMTSLMTQNQQ